MSDWTLDRLKAFILYFAAVRVAGAMQQEVTAKRGELDALQNKYVVTEIIILTELESDLRDSVMRYHLHASFS